MTAHVAQLEFFLQNLNAFGSIEDLREDVFARAGMGLPSKLAIRVYDTDGTFLRFAREYEAHKALYSAAITAGPYFSRVPRYFLERFAFQPSRHRMAILRSEVLRRSQERARQLLETKEPVAVENHDRSFCLITTDLERKTCMAQIAHAQHMWLFVFKPNNILADTNEIEATIM